MKFGAGSADMIAPPKRRRVKKNIDRHPQLNGASNCSSGKFRSTVRPNEKSRRRQ
jgi:hypothetical protein